MMYNEQDYRDVASALRSVKRKLRWPFADMFIFSGICDQVINAISSPGGRECWEYNRPWAFQDWEHFSRSTVFPVPETVKRAPTIKPGDMYRQTIFMFSRFTEYGRLRRKLLDHLIEWFDNMANELDVEPSKESK